MDVVSLDVEVLVPVQFLQLLVAAVEVLVDLHLFLAVDQPSQRIVSPDKIKGDRLGLGVQRTEAEGRLILCNIKDRLVLTPASGLEQNGIILADDAPDLFLINPTDNKLELVLAPGDDHAGLPRSRQGDIQRNPHNYEGGQSAHVLKEISHLLVIFDILSMESF